jgi:acetylornithine deacetylase/succinyl-diaminopimelate desuccinylase-like protein
MKFGVTALLLDDCVRKQSRRIRNLLAYVVCVAFGTGPAIVLAQAVATADQVFERVDAYRVANEREIVDDFFALLSLPNVADNLSDMARNADYIELLLRARGFAVQRLLAGGAPYIYAELGNNPDAETVMFYAHYDGQPILVEDWTYPPYEPTLLSAAIFDGGIPVPLPADGESFDPEWRIYARSASDDKLPIVAILHALDALRLNGIPLSINVKLLLDGEEEQGSPTLGPLLDNYASLLDADLMLFCDGPMHQSRRAQLTFGVRGDMGVDITAYGANRPLHSGHYGNWAPNPIMQLAYLLTSLRDENGRILIDGYYDDVVPLSEQDELAIANMPDMTATLLDELSVNTPEGNGARLEELIALPAVNARGFVAGGVGDNASNIVLSRATVALDLRLVANQTPEHVREQIESHISGQGFFVVFEEPSPEILRSHKKVARLQWRDGYPALRTAIDHPMSLRLSKLMRSIAPDLILTPTMGGSLPLDRFAQHLSAPIIILPLANHDNNQHAEDENLRLQNLWDAISVIGVVLATLGE